MVSYKMEDLIKELEIKLKEVGEDTIEGKEILKKISVLSESWDYYKKWNFIDEKEEEYETEINYLIDEIKKHIPEEKSMHFQVVFARILFGNFIASCVDNEVCENNINHIIKKFVHKSVEHANSLNKKAKE